MRDILNCELKMRIIFLNAETAHPGQLITTISAKDLDSGHFGEPGIRYSISGTGAELFHVDAMTGAITVAKCPQNKTILKRQIFSEESDYDLENAKNVNLTLVGRTGVIEIDTNTEMTGNDLSYRTMMNINDEYDIDKNTYVVDQEDDDQSITENPITHGSNGVGPGIAPCLDYETQPVYFLSYKVLIVFMHLRSKLLIKFNSHFRLQMMRVKDKLQLFPFGLLLLMPMIRHQFVKVPCTERHLMKALYTSTHH